MVRDNSTVFPGSDVPGRGRMRNSSAVWAGGQCVCPKCSYRLPRTSGQACNQKRCPACGAKMTAALFVF